MPQPLSSKENALFRTVVRNYEDKQYKKGLKAAEQILKKNPKHGDTNAMKALILNSMGKQDEAMALGKLALTYDMKSQVCWHVYGLLYRSVKNYEEAIKAYKFALKLDPESQQIQRDLAHLQIQMRDYQGYIVSRRAMLQARSHIRQNWTALAIAHHLAGELAEAERTLTTYEETLKNPPPKTDLEHSEAMMYKNSIIAEQGDYERALEHLETAGKHNLDRLAVLELRAEYLSKLGRKEESVKAWRALIDRNSEHTTYYQGLAAALDIPESNHKELKAIFDEYAEKYPRSDAARRTPLNFLDGDDFKTAAQAYAKRMLDKGVPSTFANLKHLYASECKKQTLLDIVTEYITNNKERAEGEAKANGDTSKGNSSAFYYLAQHYNYYLSRDLDKALEFIDKAIELEPKSVDFHMTKARIFKHKGDTQKACELMELARTLDTRDRYINTKAAKYMLRNDENDRALKTLGMFTRAETPGGPLADLIDMQCQWYMAEDGLSHARQGHVGLALKRFQHVYNFFDTWQEDQFDFHSFSLRKGHVRAYVDMIRWEDKLREHPFFSRAAIGAIKEYIKLHDKPAASNGADDAEAELERKKAAKKAKKAAEKAAAEAASKEKPNAPKPAEGPVKKVDEDPNGEKLAATKTPLEDALKFLNPLLEFSPKLVEGQLLGFEVQLRREKYVLALKCLVAASKLDADNAELKEQVARFKKTLEEKKATVNEKILEAINEQLKQL